MNAQTMDWGDIPFVLAVCETGTLSGAARKLGVNHSTVFRRIESVEKKLGVTLFERMSHGYVMTTAGEHFFQHGRVLNEGVTRIQLELGGLDLRLEGTLAITTTDSLLYRLAPIFVAFQETYPDVELQLLTDTRHLDLMQREADIAVRPTRNPPEHWIGRNLMSIPYATYVHLDYVRKLRSLPDDKQNWIRIDDHIDLSPMSQITLQRMANDATVTITNSVMGMFDLVRSGGGMAVLPCYMGETSPELVRLDEPDVKYNTDLWILAHPEIRRSARVHAFFEFATQKIRSSGLDIYGTSTTSSGDDGTQRISL
jgi:DNA-binding transcriptional LysR family regulator